MNRKSKMATRAGQSFNIWPWEKKCSKNQLLLNYWTIYKRNLDDPLWKSYMNCANQKSMMATTTGLRLAFWPFQQTDEWTSRIFFFLYNFHLAENICFLICWSAGKWRNVKIISLETANLIKPTAYLHLNDHWIINW